MKQSFTCAGVALMTLFGLAMICGGAARQATQPDISPLESENLNLYCGISILVFGGVMLWLARRSS